MSCKPVRQSYPVRGLPLVRLTRKRVRRGVAATLAVAVFYLLETNLLWLLSGGSSSSDTAAFVRSMPLRCAFPRRTFPRHGRIALCSASVSSWPPLNERIFLVTGSTDGIGKFTAEQLAKEGCTVLIHGRNAAKISATVEELSRLAPDATIHGFQADLSVMSEVRKLAAEVCGRFPAFHGLLNNAGTFDGDYTGSRKETSEGNEYSLAVNVMAPFLLTSLLLSTVRASGMGRVIVTSSVSKGSGDALSDLQLKSGWSGHRAYSLSKLCDAMMIKEMHERYGDAPQLCFHTMDPGTVDTKMLRAGWWSGGASVRTATRSFKMLTDDAYQESSGSCLGGSEISSAEKRRQLWSDLEKLTGAAWPPVVS